MKYNKTFSMMFVLMLAFSALSFSVAAEEGTVEGSAEESIGEIPTDEGPADEGPKDSNSADDAPREDKDNDAPPGNEPANDAPRNDEGPFYDDGLTDEERREVESRYTEEERQAYGRGRGEYTEEEEQAYAREKQQERETEREVSPETDNEMEERADGGVDKAGEEGAETEEEPEEEIVLDVEPGLTPDSPFYFIDEMFENPGDDPEKALEYREEKMAEALVMAREEKEEEAREALDRASSYGEIIEKEVTPEMESKIRQKSRDIEGALAKISEDLPEFEVDEYVQQEERIKLAVEVSAKIKKLCQALSELDPVQYEETCKTGDDAPRWRKDLHLKLTDEQKKHAQIFASKMKQCLKTGGKECDCQGMGVQSFEDICERKSSQAAACNEGDEEACRSLEQDKEQLFAALPDYLRPVMGELMAGVKKESDKERAPPGVEDFVPFDEKDVMGECLQEASEEECLEKVKKIKEERGEFPGYPGQKGPPERIVEFGRDCHALSDMEEKVRCFEEFYDQAKGRFSEDFGRKYNGPKEVLPAEHPNKWIGPFEEKYAEAGSDSARKDILREIKREANRRGFIVEQMGGEEGSFNIAVVHEDGTEFSYSHSSGVSFEVTEECRAVGALSSSACQKHTEESGAWQRMEQEKLEKERAYFETIDEECRAVGALSPQACKKHKADVARRGPGCDDCAAKCPGASRTGCVDDQCECYYEDEESEVEESGEGSGEEPGEGSSADSSGGESGESNSDSGSSDSSGSGSSGGYSDGSGSGSGDGSDGSAESSDGSSGGESGSGSSGGDSSGSSGGGSSSDGGSSDNGGSSSSGGSSEGSSSDSSGGESGNTVTGAIVYFPSVKKEPNAVTGFFAGVLGIE